MKTLDSILAYHTSKIKKIFNVVVDEEERMGQEE